jgi:MinD-like ATPase involved in chromosome partitioning or flagellar assembly
VTEDTGSERAPLRVLLAIGNPERERRLRDGLSMAGIAITERCLDGTSLADKAGSFEYDVALASADLHRLSTATLSVIREARLPVVLLASAGDLDRFRGLAHLMPSEAEPNEIACALREAWSRGANYSSGSDRPPTESQGGEKMSGGEYEGRGGNVIAVVAGKGAPGVTSVAIGLAAALSERRRPAILVDADLRGGNAAAYLDLDPRRGLLPLTYGGNGAGIGVRIEDELQEAGRFAVLAGLERSESRSRISSELIVDVLTALRSRFEHLVVDVGELVAGTAAPAADAVLRSSDNILIVSRGDLVSLWNARACLRYLQDGLGLPPEAIRIVLNRRRGRAEYDPKEVERALVSPVVAVFPEERRGASATTQQLPLLDARGTAARELRYLVNQLAGGAEKMPAPSTRKVLGVLRRAPAERV